MNFRCYLLHHIFRAVFPIFIFNDLEIKRPFQYIMGGLEILLFSGFIAGKIYSLNSNDQIIFHHLHFIVRTRLGISNLLYYKS